MRITSNNMFATMRRHLMTNSARLLQAQEAVATQKKINRVSDNPIDAGRVLDLTGAVARSKQYLKNIDRAAAQTGVQDGALGQVHDVLARAKELLLGEASEATSSAVTREAARLEIAHLTTQLVQVANTRFDGKYIFSGAATSTPAYSGAAAAATPGGGNTGGAAVSAAGVTDPTQLNYHAWQIRFTAPGQYDIVDTTTATTLAAGQTYTSGAEIRFGGMRLTLTDSPAPPAAGDVFDVTATPPGVYQGDGQVQEVEVQPGTTVALNVPGNRVFGGAGLNGGVDLFAVLNQINNALRTNDRPAITSLLSGLDSAREQASAERSSVGGRVNLLEAVKTRQGDIQSNLEVLRGGLEDADLAEVMTKLSQQQNAYEATLSSAAKLVQPSLLDFLR